MEIDKALENPKLKPIPCVGAFAAGRLPRCDSQRFDWQTDRSGDLQILFLCAVNQFAADALDRLQVLRSQRDADAVETLLLRLQSAFVQFAHREKRRTRTVGRDEGGESRRTTKSLMAEKKMGGAAAK